MFEAVRDVLIAHPWPGLALVLLMAFLEYIFPPVPGDSTMLFACFLAGSGALPLPAAIAACLAGSVAGAAGAYAIGRGLGHSYFFLRTAWARAELQRLERGYRRYGARLLLLNRFLPGVRGVFLYGAGIGDLGWRPVMIHSTVSNALWVGLIAWGGARLGRSWEEVETVFRRYVWGVAIFVTIYLVVSIARRRRRRAADGTTTS